MLGLSPQFTRETLSPQRTESILNDRSGCKNISLVPESFDMRLTYTFTKEDIGDIMLIDRNCNNSMSKVTGKYAYDTLETI